MTTAAQTKAKTAAESVNLRKQLADAQAKVAAFERREEAENLLLELARNPANAEMAPVGIEDFLEKRAQIESLPSMDVARSVVKLAGQRVFGGIGEPDAVETNPKPSATGSMADNFLNDFLHDTHENTL